MDVRFTPRELDIMGALWSKGPSTVSEIRSVLDDDLAHNTVHTMLRVMEGKGYVSRKREGRADRYAAEVERVAAGDSALGRVTDRLFGGSPEELLLRLVDSGLEQDELRRMRDLLDRRIEEMEDDG
ncbi:MAG: BlaI/MecI/CopY family transcriptional regulator [Gemmatimonadota bacterium]